MMKRISIGWITCLLLSGCSLVPELALPTQDVPQSWRRGGTVAEQGQAKAEVAATRWDDFHSEELNRLITQALSNNTDMQAALARVEQARAVAVIAGAGLYPQISASGSASRNHARSDAANRNDNAAQTGLSIAYELDLWQRNRNQGLAALLRLDATEYDRQALALLVISETARLYTGMLALTEREEVAERNLTTFREVLRITQSRHDAGAVSGLELAQQQSAVASTEASVAAIANQRDLFFNQLAVLTGLAPSQLTVEATSLKGMQIPALSVSQSMPDPWTLLERRPDIAQAEASLKASNIDIGVARAKALPSVQLGLSGLVSGSPAAQALSLAASFFAPIFQGGALQAEIERSKAVRDEAIAGYRGVLLTSFREVEDALSTYEAAEKRSSSFTVAAESARRAYGITRAQYKAGSVDFQSLLDTQRALLQAEDSEISAKQALFAASIDLFRTLGGEYADGKDTAKAKSS